NYNFVVKEWRGGIIFFCNFVGGGASHNYGIHVGRVAGLPAPVIQKDKENQGRLEGKAGDSEQVRKTILDEDNTEPVQMALFASVDHQLREQLKRIDVTQITPVEALNLLAKLSDEAKK